MNSIWKFPLNPNSPTLVEMPAGTQILSMQLQGGTPTLWALVDTEAPRVTRHFAIYGTGWEFDYSPGTHVGTFQMAGGSLVFHVFDQGVAL